MCFFGPGLLPEGHPDGPGAGHRTLRADGAHAPSHVAQGGGYRGGSQNLEKNLGYLGLDWVLIGYFKLFPMFIEIFGWIIVGFWLDFFGWVIVGFLWVFGWVIEVFDGFWWVFDWNSWISMVVSWDFFHGFTHQNDGTAEAQESLPPPRRSMVYNVMVESQPASPKASKKAWPKWEWKMWKSLGVWVFVWGVIFWCILIMYID